MQNEAVDNCLYFLGIAVSAAVDMLAPDCIVMGGGLSERMPEEFTGGLRKHLESFVAPGLMDDVELVVAALGDAAVVAGAASYAAQFGMAKTGCDD